MTDMTGASMEKGTKTGVRVVVRVVLETFVNGQSQKDFRSIIMYRLRF